MVASTYSNSYCEAWIKGHWRIEPVHSARMRSALLVRCLECHGPITLKSAGRNNTTRAHAEHHPRHDGCSFGQHFDGTPRPHPQQVTAPSNTPQHEQRANEVAIEDDESAFPEGKAKFKRHRHLERDGKIARSAKARRLAETDKLECEICQFDFVARYGKIGRGFIEAHHKTPVAMLDGIKKTKIEDLALVCSNCHRMLHHRDPLVTVEKFKEQYRMRVVFTK